jgi:hypothetical protein
MCVLSVSKYGLVCHFKILVSTAQYYNSRFQWLHSTWLRDADQLGVDVRLYGDAEYDGAGGERGKPPLKKTHVR